MFLYCDNVLMPGVACVLVNWNNWRDTTECLRSLQRQTYKNLTIIVVDNGSTNDSVARLRAEYPEILILENGYNAGFPKACNLGAALGMKMGAELVWMLNNDTLVPEDTAAKLVQKAVQNPNAGVIGTVLYYMHNKEIVQAWGGGYISLWTGYNRHFVKPTQFGPNTYVTFASALIRREVYEKLHGLYEGTFMYFEDSDFGLRTRKAGWDLCVAEDTRVLHKEGGSFARVPNPLLERIVTTSGLDFLHRHAAIPQVAMVLFLCSKLGKRLWLREWSALNAVLLGARDWWIKRPIVVV